MLTKEQKVKKLEILRNSYVIQDITSKTLDENVKRNNPNYGVTKKEIRLKLREHSTQLEEGIAQYSASLFDATELSNFETVLSGSALYGS